MKYEDWLERLKDLRRRQQELFLSIVSFGCVCVICVLSVDNSFELVVVTVVVLPVLFIFLRMSLILAGEFRDEFDYLMRIRRGL